MSSAQNSSPESCAHRMAVEECCANPNPQRQRQLCFCSASEFAASIRSKPRPRGHMVQTPRRQHLSFLSWPRTNWRHHHARRQSLFVGTRKSTSRRAQGRNSAICLERVFFSYYSRPYWPLQVCNAITDTILESLKTSRSAIRGSKAKHLQEPKSPKVVTAGGLNGPRSSCNGCIAAPGCCSVPWRVLCHCIK